MLHSAWRGRGLSKYKVISRVIIGVTPFRVLITLLLTLLTKSTAPASGSQATIHKICLIEQAKLPRSENGKRRNRKS